MTKPTDARDQKFSTGILLIGAMVGVIFGLLFNGVNLVTVLAVALVLMVALKVYFHFRPDPFLENRLKRFSLNHQVANWRKAKNE